MTLVNDIRKSVTDTTAVYAVVGATDLVVEKVRGARDLATIQAAQVRADLNVKALQAKAQQAPTVALTKGLELAGKTEEIYIDLAVRGQNLVTRIKRQRATQDLIAQGKVTLSRGRAAVTTVRKVVDDTIPAAKGTLTTATREGAEVGQKMTGTKAAAKRTATTARKRTTTAKSTAKSATTSARKTAAAATKATEAAASKVGS